MTFMTGRSQKASRGKARLLAMTALAAFAAPLLVTGTAAQAQTADATYEFDIPAQSLSRSINQVASRANIQVLYSGDDSRDATAPALKGRMTVDQALARLLAGSGYTYRYSQPGVITLVKVPGGNVESGELVTGVVSVEGYQGSPYFGGAGVAAGVNGINGSRDITATEGTGSFTSGALTIGSKVPQAMKDVPQSISVLTSERLEQQNVTDFTTAMKQLPGITLVQGDASLQTTFYSRGFAINSIQVDGGAPLTTGFPGSTAAYFPQIDMAQYDHVELLRGAAGTLNGYGDPSGTVNLVRKKPLDHSQFVLETQAGSWSSYRVVADATSPLALNGALRGRLVMTYQDNRHFYDLAKDNKMLIFSIVELDATPATLVTSGISYTRQDSVPWQGGLPRYQTGGDLHLPRSTSFVLPWNRWDFDTTEIFGSIEQKLGSAWTAKLNLTHLRQGSRQKLGYSQGAVNPVTEAGPQLNGIYNEYASKQFAAEFAMTGAFTIFGQRQEITVGANRVSSDGGGMVGYGSLISGTATTPYVPFVGGPAYYSGSPNGARPPINVFTFDPNDPRYTEPRNSLASYRYLTNRQVQSGAYINLRLTAFDRLHLITGLRWSRYEYISDSESLCTSIPASGTPGANNCVGRRIGDPYSPSSQTFSDDDISWPPAVNLTYDLTRNLTAYIGYTDIYLSSANYLDGDRKPVDPITGSNVEAGVKWQSGDGRLNLSIAVHRVEKKGFALLDTSRYVRNPDGTIFYDPDNDGAYYILDNAGNRIANEMVDAGHYCCFISDPNRTQKNEGIDLEVAGELLAGWQLATSYALSNNTQEGGSFGVNEGLPFLSIQPRHLYKLWTSFDFGAAGQAGWLSGLTMSVGINGQSSGYQSGTACTELAPPNALGISSCKPGATKPYSFVVPAYAVVSGGIDYRFSDKWSLALNLENVFDKTYYQSVGSVTSGNWYGAPRSVTATLRAKW